jgi:hypothetical protein
MKIGIVCSALALVLSAGTATAATSDIASHRRADFHAAGKHQFYAWCSNGQDRRIAQTGETARDAEATLLASQKVASSCRLAWQGRIPS